MTRDQVVYKHRFVVPSPYHTRDRPEQQNHYLLSTYTFFELVELLPLLLLVLVLPPGAVLLRPVDGLSGNSSGSHFCFHHVYLSFSDEPYTDPTAGHFSLHLTPRSTAAHSISHNASETSRATRTFSTAPSKISPSATLLAVDGPPPPTFANGEIDIEDIASERLSPCACCACREDEEEEDEEEDAIIEVDFMFSRYLFLSILSYISSLNLPRMSHNYKQSGKSYTTTTSSYADALNTKFPYRRMYDHRIRHDT